MYWERSHKNAHVQSLQNKLFSKWEFLKYSISKHEHTLKCTCTAQHNRVIIHIIYIHIIINMYLCIYTYTNQLRICWHRSQQVGWLLLGRRQHKDAAAHPSCSSSRWGAGDGPRVAMPAEEVQTCIPHLPGKALTSAGTWKSWLRLRESNPSPEFKNHILLSLMIYKTKK